MALRLQITSRHRQALGDRCVKEFGHDGGTIGRSLESDWVLPDGHRYISSRHASIDYRSGSYYIVDTSTNGVYVNGSETPVGRGNPQRLFNGDRVRLGEYEMAVEIDEIDNTEQQLADVNHIDPVVRAQRVPPPDPTRADLVPAHEITAVGIEVLISEEADSTAVRRALKLAGESLQLEDDPPPPAHGRASRGPQPPRPSAPAPRPGTAAKPNGAAAKPNGAATAKPNGAAQPKPRAEPPPVSAAARVAPPAVPAASPSPAASRGAATGALLDAFFRGAGLPAQRLDDKQSEQAMLRLGQIVREVIVGVTENLHVRTDQKNALRIPTTTIQPQANNPLKFSASVEEALHNLLFRDGSEYLSGVEAVREVFTDIKQHQQNLLAAMRTAVGDYMARLEPEEIESKLSNGKRGGLMNAANKLKYWDFYRDLYQLVMQGPAGELPQQMIEELARAYEFESARAAGAAARKPQATNG
ncbi:MAG TPA: type VI secretion system-associated FHA domain protein TagH [Gammaproteobacteria bacterium]|nr:type VI secretion system-associated FHA domain protein TagH [Gammaproteobacteria bacterium]